MRCLIENSLSPALIGLVLTLPLGASAQPSAYGGEQHRAIKALDAREVSALRQGQGMGFAKAAELNGYPGPMHALELAEPLNLSAGQRTATRQLMDEHKTRARAIGETIVEAEAALDRLFAERLATPDRVSGATQRIASLQAQLRAEHLNTHLSQSALMSREQTLRYDELRGYTATPPAATTVPEARQPHRH